MAAVIRLKRSSNEDPLEAVLLNCKRIKTENSSNLEDNNAATVLKLAGTIKSREEDIFKHIKKFTKTETEEQYKKHTSNIIAKLRADKQDSLKNRRLIVINSFRNPKLSEKSSSHDLSYTIFDIEDEPIENDKNIANTEYVYDLYYGHPKFLESSDLNELLSVYPLSDHSIYNSELISNDIDQDSNNSEDSNAEGNWKNDYPDESDSMGEEDSIKEDDILGAMNRVTLDGSDVSSDDDFDVYGYEDSNKIGKQYAKFKWNHDDDDNEYDESFSPCSSKESL